MILFPTIDVLLIVAIFLPFFSFFIGKHKKFLWFRNGLVISGILIALFLTVGIWKNLEISLFRTDYLGILFSFLFLFFGFLITLYSFRKNMDNKFYSLLLFVLIGLIGVSFAKDFFTLWVFWELMLISSYPLICYGSNKKLALGAALKYIFMSVAASISLLFAISFLYGSTGTVKFSDLSSIPEVTTKIIVVLIIASFGVEAVIFPFHFWAPDVYQAADISVSAIFATVMSSAGIFGLIRVLYLIFPFSVWNQALVILTLMSMTFGSFMALVQHDMKRVIAFVSIAHMAFIVFALSIGTVNGLVAGLLHTLNHAILMALLFFCLGVFSVADFRQLKKIPRFYKIIFLVAVLAASGMPPFNGFISEVLILRASIDKGWVLFSGILLFNMFLILAVFLRMVKNVLPLKTEITKLSFYSIVPMIILLLLILGLGLYPEPVLYVLQKVATDIFKF